MCDETTQSENRHWLAKNPLGRRDFTLLGAGAVASALVPGCASGTGSAPEAGEDVTARSVRITTPEGSADAFFVCPKEGRHPAVLMWPDVAGLREAYKTMGAGLAKAGYAVLVINQYYRSAPAPILNTMTEWQTEAGQNIIRPMREKITSSGIMSDAQAYAAWLDQQPEVDTGRKIGACGYCMGGPFTFRTAAANPARIGAIASFHGGGLVTDADDSPHRLIPNMKAALLIAIAQNDDARDPEAKTVLRDTAASAGRPAEIEVYPAQHGWCTIDSPVYDPHQAEKAWSRMLATFAQYL